MPNILQRKNIIRPYKTPVIVSAGGDIITSYIGADTDGVNRTVYTQSINFGTGAADDKLVIGVMSRNSPSVSVSTLTVDGNSASQVATALLSTFNRHEFWEIDLNLSGSADVVTTFSAGTTECHIFVWRLANGSGVSSLANSTDEGSDPLSTTINVSAGGCVLTHANSFAGSQANWGPHVGFSVDGTTSSENILGWGHADYASAQTPPFNPMGHGWQQCQYSPLDIVLRNVDDNT